MKKNLLKRHLRLQRSLKPDEAERVRERLEQLEALEECRIEAAHLRLRYDPLKADLAHILRLLEELQVPLDNHWLQKCLRAWYQYQDEAVCENAGAPPPACCNRPPPVGGKHG